MQFITNNKTPYIAEAMVSHDKSVFIVVKATYCFSTDGNLKIADTQKPLCYGDEYTGEPGKSSIKYTSDIVPEKKGSDIALIGHAYAPNDTYVTTVDTEFQVGQIVKTIRVTGDRFWKWSSLGITKTRPLPFNKMPLVYERAFGGSDSSDKNEKKHGFSYENPIGTGLTKSKNKAAINKKQLPNLEYHNSEQKKWNDNPIPAGYGFIAPQWAPRVKKAGTFDEDWQQNRMPLMPEDFDIGFYNAASPGLVVEDGLKGSEQITLVNLHPENEKVSFNLPGINITTAYIFEDQTYKPAAILDTLLIEPDENLFTMVWRSKIPDPGRKRELIQINIYE